MAEPKLMKAEEIADRLGIPLEAVKSYVRTRLVKGSQGRYSLDDILAIRDAGRDIKDLTTLVAEVASLKAEVMRQRQLFQFLLRVAALQQHTREFSDEQLLQILNMAKAGLAGFGPVNLKTMGKVKHLIDVALCLTDLDLRRLESVSGESRCWRTIIFLLEDINDALSRRPDLVENLTVIRLRTELAVARQQVASHGKFILALQDPYSDPRKLLGDLCSRSAKLDLLDVEVQSFDPGVVLEKLINFAKDQ
jgi:hypothetical protein